MAALEVTLHRLAGSRQMNMDAYVFPSSPCSVQSPVLGNALLTFRVGFSSSYISQRYLQVIVDPVKLTVKIDTH